MVEVRRLAAHQVREHLTALARVLLDCVEGSASVGFLWPFTIEDAESFFRFVLAEVEEGRRIVLAAFSNGELVGSVQLITATPPNQPHRADVAKLLVHRAARGRGIAGALMRSLEAWAVAEGKTLLVLDTVTGDPAERLYTKLAWTPIGVIPNYALYPDGQWCDTTVFYKSLT